MYLDICGISSPQTLMTTCHPLINKDFKFLKFLKSMMYCNAQNHPKGLTVSNSSMLLISALATCVMFMIFISLRCVATTVRSQSRRSHYYVY